MLHSIYITLDSGACIFAKHYIASKIDNQLISGFINALGAFSVEALGSEMQSLRLQTGEQLSVLKYTEGKIPLIGIIIADARDNPTLIRNLLSQILTDFYAIFQHKLETETPCSMSEFDEFGYTIDNLLEGKISSRTNLKMFIGVVIGLIIIAFILLALIPAYIELSNFNISQFGLQDIIFSDNLDPTEFHALQSIVLVIIALFMGFNCICFFLPTFLAAYIAGNRKRGIWTAIFLGLSIGLLVLIASPFIESFTNVNAILWYLAFSPLLIFIAIVCGIYGGRLKERKKLYPLEEY
ncbi:MAG: hypothetical protein ACTSYB_06560 [Candidatus Helarchaeota archaeon]